MNIDDYCWACDGTGTLEIDGNLELCGNCDGTGEL